MNLSAANYEEFFRLKTIYKTKNHALIVVFYLYNLKFCYFFQLLQLLFFTTFLPSSIITSTSFKASNFNLTSSSFPSNA